jgi:hypothetical protein
MDATPPAGLEELDEHLDDLFMNSTLPIQPQLYSQFLSKR